MKKQITGKNLVVINSLFSTLNQRAIALTEIQTTIEQVVHDIGLELHFKEGEQPGHFVLEQEANGDIFVKWAKSPASVQEHSEKGE